LPSLSQPCIAARGLAEFNRAAIQLFLISPSSAVMTSPTASLKRISYMSRNHLLFVSLALIAASSSGCKKTVADKDEKQEFTLAQQIAGVQGGQFDRIEVRHAKVSDADLKTIKPDDRLHALVLHDTSITDAGLPEIVKLTSLEHLKLDGAKITDAGLEQIAELPTLHILDLQDSEITNDGLKSLSKIENLEQLRLGSTKVTDEGLQQLVELKNLQFLHLINMPITDEGLKTIEQIDGLNSLYVDNTKISDEALDALADKKHLHIHKDSMHHGHDDHDEHGHEDHDHE
jgi:hypothetical protein